MKNKTGDFTTCLPSVWQVLGCAKYPHSPANTGSRPDSSRSDRRRRNQISPEYQQQANRMAASLTAANSTLQNYFLITAQLNICSPGFAVLHLSPYTRHLIRSPFSPVFTAPKVTPVPLTLKFNKQNIAALSSRLPPGKTGHPVIWCRLTCAGMARDPGRGTPQARSAPESFSSPQGISMAFSPRLDPISGQSPHRFPLRTTLLTVEGSPKHGIKPKSVCPAGDGGSGQKNPVDGRAGSGPSTGCI